LFGAHTLTHVTTWKKFPLEKLLWINNGYLAKTGEKDRQGAKCLKLLTKQLPLGKKCLLIKRV
jgi:hypothetical protein